MKKVWLMILLSTAIGTFVVYQVSLAKAKTGDLVLTSKKVSSAPSDAGSSQWRKAKESRIALAGAGTVEGKSLELTAKSVYTKDQIFFRFEWADKDKTLNKNRWKKNGGKWSKFKGDEDRLGVTWEINRIDKFATKGCAVLCHNESKNEKEWYYATSASKEKADMWHWKSVRSNPVGYTEDGFVTTNPSKKPEEGRKRDAGSGKAKSNRNKDKSGPAFMQNPSVPASVQDALLVTEAVEINADTAIPDGQEIPGYMLNTDWKGSFADVKTKGVWKNGRWTLMMSRKLKTGNGDDIQFNTRKRYPFAVAIFDNAHEHNSHNSEPLKLEFK